MICSKCGTQNVENSKFCIKCGNNLNQNLSQNNFQNLNQQLYNIDAQSVQQTNSIVNNQTSNASNNFANSYNESVQQEQNFNYDNTMSSINQSTTITQAINQNSVKINSNLENDKMSFNTCLFVILAVILKPFTAFKEELNKFNTFKNSLLVSLIVSGVATVVTLLKTMYSAVRVSSYSWGSETTKSWVWRNLKEINYIKTIGTNILVYLGIILAIAVVYYLASLIVKKQVNFSKFLGISALSIVPFVVCYLVVAPLLSMIYAPLNMAITIIGIVYTIILVYETMNAEIALSGNVKYYFNLICLSILSISAYYLFMKLFSSSVSNGINNILNQFGF